MERLDRIISRERDAQRSGRRKLLLVATIVLFIITITLLAVFTDLAKPPMPAYPGGIHHVDGIYLGAPKAKSK